jgi:hypothetical protein
VSPRDISAVGDGRRPGPIRLHGGPGGATLASEASTTSPVAPRGSGSGNAKLIKRALVLSHADLVIDCEFGIERSRWSIYLSDTKFYAPHRRIPCRYRRERLARMT